MAAEGVKWCKDDFDSCQYWNTSNLVTPSVNIAIMPDNAFA